MRTLFISLMASAVALALFVVGAPAGEKKPLKTFDDFLNRYDLQCMTPFDVVETPKEVKIGSKRYSFKGFRADVLDQDADKEIVIGVMGAIKENTEDTMKNVDKFLKWFKKEGVELIVVNGDVAYDEMEIADNIEAVAKSGLPVYVIIGNSETIGAFNGAISELSEKYSNIINGNLVRFVNGDDVDLISLPGYFKARFIHAEGGCLFKPGDAEKLAELTKLADDQVAFVSHGPHLQEGKAAVDFAGEAGNVGSSAMTDFMRANAVKLGIFGHILEGGGKATDFNGKTVLPEDKWSDALYLNAGSVSATPWQMNDGTTGVGMAAVVSVKPGQFKYKFTKLIEK